MNPLQQSTVSHFLKPDLSKDGNQSLLSTASRYKERLDILRGEKSDHSTLKTAEKSISCPPNWLTARTSSPQFGRISVPFPERGFNTKHIGYKW
jgi:hypothetical protein